MTHEDKTHPIVWWIIWAALLGGVFFMYLGPGAAKPSGAAAPDSPGWFVGLGALFASVIVRWWILPRARTAQSALPIFVIGLALAEGAAIMGIFVFTRHKLELFVFGILAMVQFVPFFASRFYEDQDGSPPE